jgi:succinate dehydrogenase/fumarate reductase iron-sulfur protein
MKRTPETGTKIIRVRRAEGLAEYTVATGRYTSILDALEEIRSESEPGLLYRHSCHHGSCGTCAVTANGKRVLACTTRLEELDGPIELHPLSPFPVIGDLAIDAAPLYRDFPEEASYLRPSEVNPEAHVPEEIDGFERFENCIECGLCVSACPVQARFMGPAALAAWNRELEKRPAREAEILEATSGPAGAPGCDRALRCSAVCPLGVYPAKHIAQLLRRMEKRGKGPPSGAAGSAANK